MGGSFVPKKTETCHFLKGTKNDHVCPHPRKMKKSERPPRQLAYKELEVVFCVFPFAAFKIPSPPSPKILSPASYLYFGYFRLDFWDLDFELCLIYFVYFGFK